MSPTRSYSSWRNEKLANPERAARYLTAAYNDSTEAFAHALRNVIQAHSVSVVAKNAGVARESLYRTDNPTLVTLRSLLDALGVKIPRFEPLNASESVPEPPQSAGARKRPISRRSRRRGLGVKAHKQMWLPLSYGPVTAFASAPDVAKVEQRRESPEESSSIVPSIVLLPGFFQYQQNVAGVLGNVG